MNCPKCKRQMSHQRRTISRESMLGGQYGDVSFASGYSCWNCGTWVDDPIVIVKPPMGKYVRPRAEKEYTEADRLVKRYHSAVMKMVTASESMETIAKWLDRVSTGNKCRAASVQQSIIRLKMGVLDALQTD